MNLLNIQLHVEPFQLFSLFIGNRNNIYYCDNYKLTNKMEYNPEDLSLLSKVLLIEHYIYFVKVNNKYCVMTKFSTLYTHLQKRK